MKKLISRFSDKLLSKQQLKAVKGGTHYCQCGDELVQVTSEQMTNCSEFCSTYSYPGGDGTNYALGRLKPKGCQQNGYEHNPCGGQGHP